MPIDTIVPRCSDCDRPLCGIEVSAPDFPRTTFVQAECPYGCVRPDGSPERSYAQEVRGRFHVGGHAILNPLDASDARMVTVVTDVRQEAHVTIFRTVVSA